MHADHQIRRYLRLGEVVGKRIRLIRGSARLLGTQQPCLPPGKPDVRRNRLIRRKTSLTTEKSGLSMTRQAYPRPADVSGKLDKLIDGKPTLSAPG
jgi:hypothetical protein